MSDAPQDTLRLSLEAPATARAGDGVSVQLRITNTSARVISLYLRGREPTADVLVRTTTGDTVWRKLRGASIPAILQLRLLDPGASLTLRELWPASRIDPGTYRLEAEVLTDAAPLSFPPALIRIVR